LENIQYIETRKDRRIKEEKKKEEGQCSLTHGLAYTCLSCSEVHLMEIEIIHARQFRDRTTDCIAKGSVRVLRIHGVVAHF
jgi:hypothetical protein